MVDINNVISRWPAIMFAANRTANVIGRIMILIVSIKTMKGVSKRGVPIGIKWVSILLILNILLKDIIANQQVILNVNVKIMCLVGANTKGNRAERLFNIINIIKANEKINKGGFFFIWLIKSL